MPKSSSTIQDSKGHMLIIGKPKRGKTHLLGSVSKHEKMYILSLENGLAPISKAKFDYDECNSYEEFVKNMTWFVHNYKAKGYTALGIDSLTRYQHYFVDHLKDGKLDEKLNFDQFAEMLATMRKMLDELTSQTDFVFVATVHEEDKGVPNVSNHPLLEGNIKYELAGYFDTVVVSECGMTGGKDSKMAYWARLQGNEKTIAGTRMRHLKNKKTVPNHWKHFISTTSTEGEK